MKKRLKKSPDHTYIWSIEYNILGYWFSFGMFNWVVGTQEEVTERINSGDWSQLGPEIVPPEVIVYPKEKAPCGA
jgi:hypothetical protein